MRNRTTEPTVLNGDGIIHWFDDFGPEPTNHYRFLSNFYVGKPLELNGLRFRTGEHMFQAFKADDLADFQTVAEAHSPGTAKALGRSIPLRSDWEQVKYDVMAAVLRTKFTLEREEGQLLLLTGDALLVEGTWWGDQVWGTALDREGYPGRNWLGTLLMARRAELRAERMFGRTHDTLRHNVAFIGDWLD